MTLSHDYRTRVKCEQVDIYGHLNNAQYLQLLEEARWDWISKFGGSRDLVNQLQIGPIVLEIQIQFRKELAANDEILIRSRRGDRLGRLYQMDQEIFNAQGDSACKATYRMGFLDLRTRKLVEPPAAWRDVLDEKSVAAT